MDNAALIRAQRAFFRTGATRCPEFRRARLRELGEALGRHEEALLAALREDLGKPPLEAYLSEIGHVRGEIGHALRHVRSWARDRRVGVPLFVLPARAFVRPEPFGVALVFGAWNYPLQLVLAPAVAAIAAGNCAVLKPSELAPATADAVAAMIGETFDAGFLAVARGGKETAEALLEEGGDFVFFTGGEAAAREVMKAAAAKLTPVVLELGGKSPAIVCADAPVRTAARRIAWGKFLNAGQTCVAPDHVWVDRRIADAFTAELATCLREFFGEDPQRSADYGRIINRRHFDRISSLLDGATVVHGGQRDAESLYISPTLVRDPAAGSALMETEIFGPVLPILAFEDLDEVIGFLNGRPSPLALYPFTSDRATEQRLLSALRSGGVCVNDTLMHLLVKDLPFGGIGASGMGAYHGKAGFDAFSHRRSVLRRALSPDPSMRYPPAKADLSLLRRFGRFLGI
jgi:aldehyde dehydrogenase (NAD+)